VVEPLWPEPAPSLAIPAPVAKTEWRAALLLPLSGPQAATGMVLSNAAQMALFDTAGAHFNLIPIDTKGTPEGAAAAAGTALAQGADLIVGPLMSGEVRAVAPIARTRGVPVLAFTSDRTAAGDGVFTLGFLPGQQVARVVAQAREQGLKRIGALIRADELGRAVAEALRDAVRANGLDLVALEYYDMGATDLSAPVKRLAANRPPPGAKAAFDAVLVADDGPRLRSITSLLSYFLTDGPPPRLLGTLLWDDPALGAEPQLAGGWYAAPPTALHAAFEQRYAKAFGPIPARVSATLAGIAYDATSLAAALVNGAGASTLPAPTAANGFTGVEGLFRLGSDGTAERAYAIREITAQGGREIVAAPTTFPR
jgi:ABC-type branched-subunit amino acid transport system substrate-binding protein